MATSNEPETNLSTTKASNKPVAVPMINIVPKFTRDADRGAAIPLANAV